MSECCTNPNGDFSGQNRSNQNRSNQNRSNQNHCPVNGKPYRAVHLTTLLHHIKRPWEMSLADQNYYFCTDPDCPVVYFGEDGLVINTTQMRTGVWQKTPGPDSTVCYCFGVSMQQAHSEAIKHFVTEKTKQSQCACQTSNPSGRCCLTDFPKAIAATSG
jgi:hypothetical protein